MFLYGQVKVQTELGQEKRCMCCGEYWPSDLEFFEVMRSSRDGLTPRCIACIKEKLWQITVPAPSARPQRTGYHAGMRSCYHEACKVAIDRPSTILRK